MRKRELQVKITEYKSGGEIISYNLMLCRNGHQWWGSEIDSADQMRQIAAALIAKADEIEHEKMMNEPNLFCEDCGCVLYNDNIITIVKNNPQIYVCVDCYKKD